MIKATRAGSLVDPVKPKPSYPPLKKVREIREQKQIKMLSMAQDLGISESYYCYLEAGKRKLSLERALKIAAILKKNPNYLFNPKDFGIKDGSL